MFPYKYNSQCIPNSDEVQYIYALGSAPRKNIGFILGNYQTTVRIKQEYRAKLLRTKCRQGYARYTFAERCTEQSPVILDIAAKYKNSP
jgi:hypothetical protein